MAYKEMKLKPGEAKGLSEIWNAGMPGSKKSAEKKPAAAKKQTEKKSKK